MIAIATVEIYNMRELFYFIALKCGHDKQDILIND